MGVFNVITGFGYITETATSHVLMRVQLPAGVHSIQDGYEYTEVADEAAMNAVELYQAPPGAPVPVLDVQTTAVNQEYLATQTEVNQQEMLRVYGNEQNSTGGVLVLNVVVTFVSNTQTGITLMVGIADDAAFEVNAVNYAIPTYGAGAQRSASICLFVPKNKYWNVNFSMLMPSLNDAVAIVGSKQNFI